MSRLRRWFDDAVQDLRYAGVQLRRSPGHAVVVLLIVAAGIGVNAAVFGVVDELLLRPLPVAKPRELVLFNWLEGRARMRMGLDGVQTVDPATGRPTSTSFSYPTFLRLRDAGGPLTDLFAFAPIEQLNTVAGGRAEIASGQYVSGTYFRGLGVTAPLGRTLAEGDDRPGAPLVLTITDDYWQRRFGRDAAIVGRSLLVNRTAFTIVGVTPPGFAGALDVGQPADLTLPFAAEPVLRGDGSQLGRPADLWVRVMGRLAPGGTTAQAAALDDVMRRAMLQEWHEAIAKQPGDGHAARTLADTPTLRAEPGGQGLMDTRRRYAQPLLVLWLAAGVVLAIACLNLANLLLARGAARQREIATRLAIGAGRGRVVRQLLTESLLLSALGAAGGLAIAVWTRSALEVWRPWGGTLPATPVSIDARQLLFCAALALATSVVFGLVPAWRLARTGLTQVARRDGAGPPPVTKVLVVAQVALSVVLLVAAAIFVRTLQNLRGVETGFNADRLLLFRVQPQLNGHEGPALARFYRDAIARIAAVPGVRSVAVSRHALLGASRRTDAVAIEGAPAAVDASVHVNVVSPGFLDAMEIPLRIGRGLRDGDEEGAPLVAVVNERFVAAHLGGSHSLGRRFRLGTRADAPPIEIVGVARDAKYTDLRSPIVPTVYLPLAQHVPGQASVAVRTAGPPLALAGAVREALRAVDPTLPPFELRTQAAQGDASMAREALFARLSALYGALALLLVTVGLYGVTAWSVARRTTEIGVRMALGARRATVLALVVREVGLLAGAGVAIGVPIALAAARAAGHALEPLLFGVSPIDPLAFGGATVALVAAALLAAVGPARRAAAVDPIVALKSE